MFVGFGFSNRLKQLSITISNNKNNDKKKIKKKNPKNIIK